MKIKARGPDPSVLHPGAEADVCAGSLSPTEREATAERSTSNGLVEHLVCARKKGGYDHRAADLLASVSAWAYSDDEVTLQGTLRRHDLDCICTRSCYNNDALLVAATVYVIQSRDGRLAILCFRGTEPKNVINWLGSASFEMEPFESSGRVHGGFQRGIAALWEKVRSQLTALKNGQPIGDVIETSLPKRRDPSHQPSRSGGGAEPLSKLEALYITGHSLGGALAVLAAARIHTDSDLQDFQGLLRGVYTFGQPMVGDRGFKQSFRAEFGDKLFRHVYKNDIAPSFPPRTAGPYEHFGSEYRSTPLGWVLGTSKFHRALTFLPSMVIGALAWVKQQTPYLNWLPELPFSWGDHSPLNYLRTSRAVTTGTEFK
jgi:hypothetical protein